MFKKVIISGLLVAMLSFSATFANAGIIILGKDGGSTTSSTSSVSTTLSNTGIIILGFTTGIIILGATDQPPATSDGIIILG
jgi:hypothetical protein